MFDAKTLIVLLYDTNNDNVYNRKKYTGILKVKKRGHLHIVSGRFRNHFFVSLLNFIETHSAPWFFVALTKSNWHIKIWKENSVKEVD